MYTFGICFLQAEVTYLLDLGGKATEDEIDYIRTWWGSAEISMLTLFMSATGGEDWSRVAEPLKKTGTFFYVLFLLYIAFIQIVMMNTITSVFIVGTTECS